MQVNMFCFACAQVFGCYAAHLDQLPDLGKVRNHIASHLVQQLQPNGVLFSPTGAFRSSLGSAFYQLLLLLLLRICGQTALAALQVTASLS